jgi:hypothetical protein
MTITSLMCQNENESQDDEDPLDVPPDRNVTRKLFRTWRAPRYGERNPDRMNNPVWEWLVRSRATAYGVAQRFGEPSALEVGTGWCFYRSGRSGTTLPDGRQVLIGGEHEDSYDPDFFIYNDVVVLHPDVSIDIFGYPRNVFPPTDFHSATLAGDRIFIIGCLGYPDQRQPGTTPVFFLDLKTFAIHRFPTTGTSPNWLHRHTAELSADGMAIILKGGRCDSARNINDWKLWLESGRWEQLTHRPWQIWQLQRADNHMMHLWQIRSQLMLQRRGEDPVPQQLREIQEKFSIPTLEEELGGPLDADAAEKIFQPPVEFEPLGGPQEFGVHRIRVNDVTIRYEEDIHDIEVTFEGALPQKLINTIVKDLQAKLARLERSPCTAKRVEHGKGRVT